MPNVFRFNVLDDQGTTSFTGPAHGLKLIAAACSSNPENLAALLSTAQRYDPDWITSVRHGLSVFDEHNVSRVSEEYVSMLEDGKEAPPFRVMDALTRTRSMEPSRLGLVVFNLKERRIIQLQNSYAELSRKGRGRIRENGKPTRTLFHYDLPESWSIVP